MRKNTKIYVSIETNGGKSTTLRQQDYILYWFIIKL